MNMYVFKWDKATENVKLFSFANNIIYFYVKSGNGDLSRRVEERYEIKRDITKLGLALTSFAVCFFVPLDAAWSYTLRL